MNKYPLGVLLVHGIQGSPKQFRFLTDLMPENVRINCLMLPGHGSSVREFRQSGKEEWLRAVFTAAEEMRAHCDTVIFIGHSMGCLLGILTANTKPGIFDAMLLLCCPYSLRLTLRYLKYNILSAQKVSANPYVLAIKEANSVSAACPLAYLMCIHPYMDLLRLIRKAKNMNVASVPTYFLFSGSDEIIGRHSAVIAESNGASSVRTLPNCGHQYFTQSAKDEIAQTFFDIVN